jgi:hypothetical protein
MTYRIGSYRHCRIAAPAGAGWRAEETCRSEQLSHYRSFVLPAEKAGRIFLLGCIQAMRCPVNTFSAGVTTHNKRVQRRLVFEEKAFRVANYVLEMNRDDRPLLRRALLFA